MSFAPDVAGAVVRASPNHGERTPGPVGILLLHYTGMPTGAAALDWLCDPRSEVSCHYLVHEDGGLVQLVPEARRAWHAGRSFWAGETDVNSRSMGVEIVNPGHEFGYRDFPEPQIEAVIRLGHDIVGRHGIRPEGVLAHSDVAPERKRDPGERFPWKRLAEAGLGLWVEPGGGREGAGLAVGDVGPEIAELKSLLGALGYAVSQDKTFDAALDLTVRAFQRRYRPERIDGRAGGALLETIRALLRAVEQSRVG